MRACDFLRKVAEELEILKVNCSCQPWNSGELSWDDKDVAVGNFLSFTCFLRHCSLTWKLLFSAVVSFYFDQFDLRFPSRDTSSFISMPSFSLSI